MPTGGNIGLANGDDLDLGSLLLSSLDDESFVVLERSTANGVNFDASQATQALHSLTGSFPVFNNVSSTTMNSSRRTSHVCPPAPVESLCLPFESANISVSAEEIDKRLQELLHENITLKENLYQTNLAMKQQLSTVALLQEKALDVQRNHTSKFEETKTLILKLTSEKNELQETINVMTEEIKKIREENKKLQEINVALGTDKGKVLAEKDILKNQVSVLEESLECAMNENAKKTSIPSPAQRSEPSAKEAELHHLVDQLSRKLESVERARRQQDFDIERLQAQLGRASHELTDTQRRLAHAESDLQIARTQTQIKPEEAISYGENIAKYDELLKQLKSSIHREETKFNSLQSWIKTSNSDKNSSEFEVAELRRLLCEEQTESVARKENLFRAVAVIHELLGDYQKIGEQLERAKADYALKESHGAAYNETQRKGFTEKIDGLTSQLVEKEEALAIAERHLASLQEAVRLQNDEKKAIDKDHWRFNLEEFLKKILYVDPARKPIDDGQVKTLKEQAQVLTSELAAKEDKSKSLSKEIYLLKSEIQKLRTTNDTVAVFEEQAKIYQADFEAERKARETLVAEKDRLLDDLRHLQRRNQDLIDEMKRLKQGQTPPASATPATETVNARNTDQQPQIIRQTPRPRQFLCPNSDCNMPFNTVEEVHEHVVICWGLHD